MPVTIQKSSLMALALAFISISTTLSQQVVTNVPFNCAGRRDGFWRDLRYCDVFHACVAGEQKRSYGCPQVGERFYFDDNTQKCEFAARNTGGCQANQYLAAVTSVTLPSGSQLSTQAPSEPWKIFAQSREQFSCANRQDGFYASRWCNVFYRCADGVSNAFLCPLQRGGSRLWWSQHGSSQGVPEGSAACSYPCDTGRQCSSAGGILVDSGSQMSESQQEAEAAYRQSPCSNQTTQTGTGQFGVGQTGPGQTSSGQIGTGLTGSGQTVIGPCPPGQVVQCVPGLAGSGQTGTGQTGSGQTGGGGSSSTGGSFTVDSNVNCNGQVDGAFIPSSYCNVFHRCVSGTRFDFLCPRAKNATYELWWNQQTNRCDWPCRVQCNNPLYGSSMSAQQVSSDSLVFFNNECRAYPIIFN